MTVGFAEAVALAQMVRDYAKQSRNCSVCGNDAAWNAPDEADHYGGCPVPFALRILEVADASK